MKRPDHIPIYLSFQLEVVDSFEVVLGAAFIPVYAVGANRKYFMQIQVDLRCNTELISAFVEVEFAVILHGCGISCGISC